MLNRRQLRIKVLQALYAFNRSNGENYSAGEKELFFSLEKIYDMYLFYLTLFDDLRLFSEFRIEENKKKKLPTEEDLNPNTRFIDNKILNLLSENKNIKSISENRKINWMGERENIKKLYYHIVEDECYINYMALDENSFEADKVFVVKLFKSVIANFEPIHHFLEEKSIYWTDDIDFVCSMVLKTVKSLNEDSNELSPILSLFKDEKDERNFAKILFRSTIVEEAEMEALIKKHSDNWDVDRIATMDVLLMKMAITEAKEFDTIPLKVTLNEYIDISKFYSTPKSKGFINGILDRVFSDLQASGEIKKIGRGLI